MSLSRTSTKEFPGGLVLRNAIGSEIIESAKTDPVRFKRCFEAGLLKDRFAFFFEASFLSKSPVAEKREAACKRPNFTSKKGPVLDPLETGPDQFFRS